MKNDRQREHTSPALKEGGLFILKVCIPEISIPFLHMTPP
jgi:hypothetical protein